MIQGENNAAGANENLDYKLKSMPYKQAPSFGQFSLAHPRIMRAVTAPSPATENHQEKSNPKTNAGRMSDNSCDPLTTTNLIGVDHG
jgi:hypothetical protein